MPIFVFLLVEGYVHTKDFKKYFFRMFFFAIIMGICNWFMMDLAYILNNPFPFGFFSPNVFLPMSVSLLSLKSLDVMLSKDSRIELRIISALTILFSFYLSLNFEYKCWILVLSFIFYIFRYKKYWMCILFVVISFIVTIFFKNYPQCFMIFSIIPILAYNGEKGDDKFPKYFFYIFYPFHIYLFVLFSYFI